MVSTALTAVPYKFLKADPDLTTALSYFRTSDYFKVALIGTVFPAAFYAWERRSPSLPPRLMTRVLSVQIPFFVTMGGLYSLQNVYFRFWGWKENTAEELRFESEN